MHASPCRCARVPARHKAALFARAAVEVWSQPACGAWHGAAFSSRPSLAFSFSFGLLWLFAAPLFGAWWLQSMLRCCAPHQPHLPQGVHRVSPCPVLSSPRCPQGQWCRHTDLWADPSVRPSVIRAVLSHPSTLGQSPAAPARRSVRGSMMAAPKSEPKSEPRLRGTVGSST